MEKEEKIILQWESAEDKINERNIPWIIISVLASIAIIIYSISSKEWFMGAVFVVAIFTLTWSIISKPFPIQITITSRGIWLGKTFYDFDKIRGYWFNEKERNFYIEQKGKIGLTLSFPIGTVNPEEIKMVIPDYLIELKEKEENILDRLTKRFKSN